MYWFRRPPYLRWAAAGLLVVAALGWEVRQASTVLHPFAAVDLTAGKNPTEGSLQWRAVPVGLLPDIDPSQGILLRRVPRGEPLVPSALGAVPPVPPGWWALPVGLPPGAAPGQSVRLVVVPVDPLGEPSVVPGMVIEPARSGGDLFAFGQGPGLVAVPEAAVTVIAAGVAEGRVSVALAPAR